MFVQKSFGLTSMAKFTGHHVLWLTAWASLVAFLYEYFEEDWIRIPWLPLSVIGTAVQIVTTNALSGSRPKRHND